MPNPNPGTKGGTMYASRGSREWALKAAQQLHMAECLCAECDEKEEIICQCEECECDTERIEEVITAHAYPVRLKRASYMELLVGSLAEAGQPVHILALLDRVREKRGNPNITRTSIETTLLRHVASKGDQSRIVKIRPGVYAMRTWADAAVTREREAEAVSSVQCGQADPVES